MKESGGAAAIFERVIKGAAMGIAFVIPGFSGGSVAAILGIYEELVGAVADLFRHFGKSVRILLPVALGMALGFAALLFPIRYALERFPLPTVALFVGLALGGLGPLGERAGKRTFRHVLLFTLALLFSAAFAFFPKATPAEGFLYHLGPAGYCALFGVGALASCALVVPGISGSMLLLILGYYAPLSELLTDFLLFGREAAASLAVLAVFGGGMLLGFFLISHFMRALLGRYPHAVYCAILGLIFGSSAGAIVPVAGAGTPLMWGCALLLFLLGMAGAWLFTRFLGRKRRG